MTSNAEADLIKQTIISSLFSSTSKGSAGQTGQSYIAHCKTWEDSPGGERKPRYILLAVAPTPQVFLHKSKRNSNGTFSIGKTWDTIDLRAIELIDDSAFKLTLGSRSYTWMAENVYERAEFVDLLVRAFRQYTNGTLPTLINVPSEDYSLPAYSMPSATSPGSTVAPARGHTPVPATRSQPSRSAIAQTPQTPRSPVSSIRPHQVPSTPSRNEPSRAGSVEPHPSPSRAPTITAPRSRTPVNEDRASSPKSSKFMKSKSPLPAKEVTSNRLISSPLRSNQERTEVSINSPKHSIEKVIETPKSGIRSARSSKRAEEEIPEQPQTEIEAKVIKKKTEAEIETQVNKKKKEAEIETQVVKKKKEEEVNGFETHDVLANVEEMLEGFEWKIGSGVEGVDRIEERLLNELKALELAEIHAIIENDDRVDVIGKYFDEGLAELDKMEAMLSLYRTQLNLVSDDLIHIESQNRGFQVQISNQRSLLEEIEELVQTIHIPRAVLDSLVQEPLDSQKGISNLEKSITTLYKAILSVRDLAAGSENSVDEYKREAKQFCKRVYEFLLVMFKYQADLVLNEKNNRSSKASLKLPSHEAMEKYLERYCGLTLFMKEIDEARYQQLCVAYFATSSELHKQEISELIAAFRNMIRKPADDEIDTTFATPPPHSPTHNKSSTTGKMFNRKDKKDASGTSGTETMTAGQALVAFSQTLLDHLQREQAFVGDFLHIHSGLNEGNLMITFADYTDLEGYFKRAAINLIGINKGKMKDLLSVMDLIFGFLPGEIKDWIEWIVSRDPMQMVSVLAALDMMIKHAEEVRNEFLVKTLEAQQRKSLSAFERTIKEQLKAIESTKLTVKKRKGVVGFVAMFPEFVTRLERQLELDVGSEVEAEELPTRKLVNKVYGQIVQAMFEALQTMAKSDEASAAGGGGGGGSQEDRDKDRLNYHTLIIENMHHFVTTVSKVNAPALKPFLEQAKEQYDQNLNLYIRLVLRRPLARFIDFFQGIQQLLRTTSPTEISLHSQYTKSALKRLLGSFDKKDVRKAVEALAKRVDKHFTDVANPSAENSVVMNTVWVACEAELGKWIEEWKDVLNKCYAGEGLMLEFGIDDVRAAFLKYKPEHGQVK
ncbi:hypothetical protein CROQUDRAFT_671528 [Cronartium quercuum f. sp. fusiforme G11]|uniref:Exocyst complex component Sec3 PIP2-binding N-terminal domain-containing protein n=1 Tax=Cronartium quercuum f. sp. fusiforme G11 TaxID=708437 RepID=A0A9P6NLN0_9BASI|nr:hypothetical protein CROQUDRAFT_671528 [Cronartium quercuum f. sp. fusiforme G11]